jgi:hypothetical protein
MNEMSPLDGRYERMIAAIAECHSVDECKETANRSEALAAYARQIHDDRSLKQYLEIKIRAWRRIGELLCEIAGIKPIARQDYGGDVSGPSVPTAVLRKMRTGFSCALTDVEIRRAAAVASIDGDFFELRAKGEPDNPFRFFEAYSAFMRDEWLQTPEGKEYSLEVWKEQAERRARVEEAAELPPYSGALKPGPDTVTIDIVVTKRFHEMIRQAAFERKVTQQYLIRAALVEWFVDKDYDPPTEDE